MRMPKFQYRVNLAEIISIGLDPDLETQLLGLMLMATIYLMVLRLYDTGANSTFLAKKVHPF